MMPEDYPYLFDKKLPAKQEEDTDDDSRFSRAEEESVGKPPENKRRKLKSPDSSDEESDWDSDDDNEVELVYAGNESSKQAFMRKSLFHLNYFIDAATRTNKGFGLFIKEGVATPGFDKVPFEMAHQIGNLTHGEIIKLLLDHEHWNDSAHSQIATWLKYATVGSFIIMCHEYPKCKFCPKILKPNGTYIG